MIKAYHGTNARFPKFDQNRARIFNDFYGGGVAYFTDHQGVSISYAKSMAKRGGSPYVYEVLLNLKRVFDVDHKFSGHELTKFYDDKTVEQFARGAGLLGFGNDKYIILNKLREGAIELTGDQVFRGLSKGMVNTAEARKKLILLGYDGLRYNGGLNMNMATRHNVYLAYDAKDINIQKVYSVQPKTKEAHQMVAESVTYNQYIKKHKDEVRTLNVWDIDDTLFKTSAQIIVKRNGKVVKKLDPSEYNTYQKQPGDEMDFSEFRSGVTFRQTATPIASVLDRAKSIIWNQSENSKSILLTARADLQDHEEFLQAFRDHGFPIDHVYIERSGNLHKSTPASKTHILKAVVLKKYINSGEFDRVRVWDDSKANLDMLLKLANDNVEVIAYHVDHNGKVTKYGSKGSSKKVKNIKDTVRKAIRESVYS